MHTIVTAPKFEDRRPPDNALVWRVSLSAARAFCLICDIGHLYPVYTQRPRVGAMLERDGNLTLYVWPKAEPDSNLLLTLLDYGAARQADLRCWHGQTWLTGDLLCRVLATLTQRSYQRQLSEVTV